MMRGHDATRANCDQHRAIHDYTHLQELIDNLPYLFMGLCGSAIFLTGFGTSLRGWLAAALYFGYCLAGALWIIRFVCPYCQFHGTRACPCGYGQFAAKLAPRAPEEQFARQFRRHIPVIVPLWLLPPMAGIYFFLHGHSTLMLVLLIVFAVDAFILLPLVSRLYGCGHCSQKEDCPWMLKRKNVPV